MTSESHWQHLKHTYLGFMHQPQLDQMVYTMINNVIPAELIKARDLDGRHLIGWPVTLMTFQEVAKKTWIELMKRPCSATDYAPSIKNWTCRCGGQQLQVQHFCKHLVQVVEAATPQPKNFFEKLTCHQVMPIYKFPHITNIPATEGSISDGDDDIWMGSHDLISKSTWRLIYNPVKSCKQSHSPPTSVDEASSSYKRSKPDAPSNSDVGENDIAYGSDAEEMLKKEDQVHALIINLTRMAETLKKQMENPSPQWLLSITSLKLFKKVAPTIQDYLQAVQNIKNRHNSHTFPVTNEELCSSQYTFTHKV
ncbi:hypothetical protein BS47DRAFT_1369462 [Hydnum rufescens UP504]|uniref:SWIM-type domain-containing protein n=1 Tax=Hydnum rufescens UP504 TaxID=1448309 RepID=A0A9P6ADG6_9AGAM|nr:hypothetical protein BS47DRAFT_1369462 [Hydnum rufescens UP504]